MKLMRRRPVGFRVQLGLGSRVQWGLGLNRVKYGLGSNGKENGNYYLGCRD